MRVALHYLAAMIVIPVYGIQVCPYLDSLTAMQVAVPVIIALSLQFAARGPLRRAYVMAKPLPQQSTRAFKLELFLFLLTATALTFYNLITYDFPIASGLKVMVGLGSLGFFAATDLALKQERIVARIVTESGQFLDPDEGYFPLTTKIALFAAISITLVIGVFMLLVNKDLSWLVEVDNTINIAEARIAIIKEFLFVFVVILPHTLNIILSYSKNLRGFFDSENGLLKSVTAGDLTGSVPVGTNDEFGVMAKHTNLMVERIRRDTEEIRRTRDTTILTLASLAETRDNETGAHILRTQRYVKALAESLKDHPRFSDFLTEDAIDLLYKSAPLHDIGKVGIPDAILLKPGKLTDEEFEIMKTHAAIGNNSLAVAEAELGRNDFLGFAREISLSHHEKWDGSGYPQGLSGDDIPISGRLMAVADVYDALISKRVYKPAFPHEKAMEIILEGRGKHFDPDIVDALLDSEDTFKDIARVYCDSAYGNPAAAAE
ncbi:MAG: HD domain-containing protein [Proteobacteria bacterium]|nr:HD domain-containing protein [Pseudomonadota bacterium]